MLISILHFSSHKDGLSHKVTILYNSPFYNKYPLCFFLSYLSEAPHAVPHALGLSAAPQAAGASVGLSPAPQAAGASAGLSPAPHALPQEAAAFVSLFQSAKFESAIILFLLLVFI
jgi:hypothetical protein